MAIANSGKVEMTSNNRNLGELTMADDSMTFWDVLGQQERGFSAEPDGTVLEQLMDFEVTSRIQAGRHERSEARQTGMGIGNDRCTRGWARWSCRYRSCGKGVIFRHFGTAPTRGTGTDGGHPGSVDRRDVDAQSRRTGSSARHDGHHQSQVSALCRDIDERVKSFLERPLEGEWPYLWLDATYLKVRKGRSGGVGRRDNRQRRQPGRAAGNSRLGAGRLRGPSLLVDFLRRLHQRGLSGVQLIISDAHEGLEGHDQPSLYG